jgi:non-canonical poly(A) RNA polymerase PAPD5/7
MRGLNEPVNGGIGGFSVICLVVSLLQLMPQVQSGTMIPEHNLGEILMEFLDLYGNQFDSVTNAIVLKPPGYVNKVCVNQISTAYCSTDFPAETFECPL